MATRWRCVAGMNALKRGIYPPLKCDNGIMRISTSKQKFVSFVYEFNVKTGDRFGGGTDAKVYVKIVGEKGESDEVCLPSKKGDLERGMLNRYKVSLPELGELKSLQIRHNNTGLAPAWFLEKIDIADQKGHRFSFMCNDWLDSRKGGNSLSKLLHSEKETKNRESSTLSRKMEFEQKSDAEHLKRVEKDVHGNLKGVLQQMVEDSSHEDEDIEAEENNEIEEGGFSTALHASSNPTVDLPSPAVRFLLDTYGLQPSKLTPSGRNGRLLKGDVLNFMKENNINKPIPQLATEIPKTTPLAPPPQFTTVNTILETTKKEQKPQVVAPLALPHSSEAEYTDLPNTNTRTVIAKRLTESKTTIPHVYASAQCDITALKQAKNSLKKDGIAISLNDLIIKVVAKTLMEYPEVNARWSSHGEIELLNDIDISVAVATDKGLITPIVKNASSLDITTLSKTVKDLAERARSNKLKPEEFQGGSFSISNLGMFGITQFSAVINPPQSCILAVGGTALKLDEDGQMNPVLNLTISCDGRVINDELAGAFLCTLKRYFENPLL